MIISQKKKKTILIIGTIVILFLLVSGAFLVIRNSSETKNSSNKPPKEQKKDKLISPKKDNPDNPQPNPVKNDKTEIKVFWSGKSSSQLIEGYDDHWFFVSEKNPAKRFLISQNYPVLLNKKLDGGVYFTLSYAENEIVKTGQRGSQLTLLKSGFTLTPDSPLQDDPNFLTNYEKGETKKWVKFVGWSSRDKDNPGQDLTFNNYLRDEPTPDKIEIFYISRDCQLARQLIRENKLQVGKKFILSFTQVAEYDEILNCWYFDPTCDRKIWVDKID